MPTRHDEDWDDDPPVEQTDPFDLGNWLGRWQAFGLVAGRCSSADIECLREIRDKKLYKSKTRTWALFCSRYLGLGRAQADRYLQYLDEFGPNYFHLTAIVRVSPQTFRAISHNLREGAILLRETPIALIPENAGRILRAVRELRRQAAIDERALPPASSWKPGRQTTIGRKALRERLGRFTTRLDALVQALAAVAALGLDPQDEDLLAQAAQRGIDQLSALKRALRR
jgi:hypothetical protein